MEKKIQSVEDVLADEAFLAWYFRNSDSEAKKWEQYITSHPEITPLMDDAIRLLRQFPAEKQVELGRMEESLASIQQRLGNGKVVRSNWIWRWAAAAAVLFLAAALWYSGVFTTDSETALLAETSFGKKTEIRLSDGTSVQLNANTQLRGKKEWKEGEDRELWLSGEAFFQVKHLSKNERLLVHTSEGTIVVTGTSFNVRARGDSSIVFLTEGQVLLQAEDAAEITLQPGDRASIRPHSIQRSEGNWNHLLAWKDGLLELDHVSIAEFAAEIEATYGMKVKVEGSVPADFRLSGILPNRDLAELLHTFEQATNWTARQEKGLVIFVVH